MRTKGWKQVFAFTFIQQIKTKSFIISTIIITLITALIAAGTNIIPAFIIEDEFGGGGFFDDSDDTTEAFTISKLYVRNDTEYDFSFDFINKEYPSLTVEAIDADTAKTKIEELKTTTEPIMMSYILIDEDAFVIDSYCAGEDSGVESMDCDNMNSLLAKNLKSQFLTISGLSEDKLELALNGFSTYTTVAGDSSMGVIQTLLNMIVPMVSSIVLFIFIFSYSQLVAQAIAIEKASRVMEYLLTSIKPLAVIIGKILAMCCVSLMQFMIISMGAGFGFLVSMPFGFMTKLDSLMSATSGIVAENSAEVEQMITEFEGAFVNINAGFFLVVILSFVLGFLLYALIAGLAGASISKMEDLSAAIQPMSLIGVLGFYLAYMPQIGLVEGGEVNPIMVLAQYLPISSPFCLPSAYALGQIDTLGAILSLLILLATVILMTMLVAKVYEHIILHTGNRLKIGDMLKMAKKNK